VCGGGEGRGGKWGGAYNPEIEHEADYDDDKVGDEAQAREATDDVEPQCRGLGSYEVDKHLGVP
jgi:hypothetical protein